MSIRTSFACKNDQHVARSAQIVARTISKPSTLFRSIPVMSRKCQPTRSLVEWSALRERIFETSIVIPERAPRVFASMILRLLAVFNQAILISNFRIPAVSHEQKRDDIQECVTWHNSTYTSAQNNASTLISFCAMWDALSDSLCCRMLYFYRETWEMGTARGRGGEA